MKIVPQTKIASKERVLAFSVIQEAKPEEAKKINDHFKTILKQKWPKVKSGEFAADMKVSLVNDGPVTIILE